MSRVDPFIFREYIGVKNDVVTSLKNFPDAIIDPDVKQFHFILGFARDTYVERNGTGRFTPYWNSDFFGLQHVKDLKKKHPHVKVVISIGGRDADCPFSPAAIEDWCGKAVSSLIEIIRSYDGLIDGVDINYGTVKSSDTNFSYCIGKVIKGLKKHVEVVSIAPSLPTQSPYKTLYMDNHGDIDYVHYQFYIQKIDSKQDFIDLFNDLTQVYTREKLLAGASTDGRDTDNFKRGDFYDGCKHFVNTASLRGIFIWSANDSVYDEESPFSLEKRAQEILTKKN